MALGKPIGGFPPLCSAKETQRWNQGLCGMLKQSISIKGIMVDIARDVVSFHLWSGSNRWKRQHTLPCNQLRKVQPGSTVLVFRPFLCQLPVSTCFPPSKVCLALNGFGPPGTGMREEMRCCCHMCDAALNCAAVLNVEAPSPRLVLISRQAVFPVARGSLTLL